MILPRGRRRRQDVGASSVPAAAAERLLRRRRRARHPRRSHAGRRRCEWTAEKASSFCLDCLLYLLVDCLYNARPATGRRRSRSQLGFGVSDPSRDSSTASSTGAHMQGERGLDTCWLGNGFGSSTAHIGFDFFSLPSLFSRLLYLYVPLLSQFQTN